MPCLDLKDLVTWNPLVGDPQGVPDIWQRYAEMNVIWEELTYYALLDSHAWG